MSRKKRKRKQPGHFCWACGRRRPNEKFSGRGHARHVCRECAKLGAEELAYRQALRNLERCMTWEGNGPAIVWSGACSAIRLNGRLAACLLWPVPAVQPNAQLNSVAEASRWHVTLESALLSTCLQTENDLPSVAFED